MKLQSKKKLNPTGESKSHDSINTGLWKKNSLLLKLRETGKNIKGP